MRIELNFKSGVPAYMQIVGQVKTALATGALRAGDQLPSIRALAEQTRVNRNTVAKAYTELEHEGVVRIEQGRGVYCQDTDSRLDARTRRRMLADALDAVIVQAYHLQLDAEKIRSALDERLLEFEKRLAK